MSEKLLYFLIGNAGFRFLCSPKSEVMRLKRYFTYVQFKPHSQMLQIPLSDAGLPTACSVSMYMSNDTNELNANDHDLEK